MCFRMSEKAYIRVEKSIQMSNFSAPNFIYKKSYIWSDMQKTLYFQKFHRFKLHLCNFVPSTSQIITAHSTISL